MDVEPGGRLRSWLRAGPVGDGGLAMIGEAAGMPLVSSDPPHLTGCGAETLPIDLGKPVAFLGREPKGGNGFLGRVRWLAEKGLGTRLRLALYPLTPDRPLRTAERTLLSQALEETFTPDAGLGGRRGPAFAAEALAEALVGECAAACPTADPSAGVASQASGSPAI